MYYTNRNCFGRGLLLNENISCLKLTAEQIDSNLKLFSWK